jgi:2-methylcitrate dehydratase PrpD
MTKRLPMERPARVVITATDGRQWMGEAGVNRGDDASPYTTDELTTKFMDLCGRVWSQAHAERVLQATHALCAGQETFGTWTALLAEQPLERAPPVVFERPRT